MEKKKEYQPNPDYAPDVEMRRKKKEDKRRKRRRFWKRLIVTCLLLFFIFVWPQTIPTKTGLDSGWNSSWNRLQRVTYQVEKLDGLSEKYGLDGEYIFRQREYQTEQQDLVVGDFSLPNLTCDNDPWMRTAMLVWFRASYTIIGENNSLYVFHKVPTVEMAEKIAADILLIYDYKDTQRSMY